MTASRPESRSLLVEGAGIEYSDREGEGDPILLIHGGVFGAWFAPLVAGPALEELRVIPMLRTGYASGPAPAGHVTIADHAAHCAALLDTLGIDRAHVLAHSLGSVVALQLALDRPDLVEGLILSEPPLIDCLVAPEDAEFLRTLVGPAVGGAMAAAGGDVAAAFDGFMRAICGPDYRAVLRDALGPEGLARAEHDSRFFFANEIRAVGDWRFDANIASGIRQPVLLVQGGASPPPVHRLVARLAAMIPGTQVATVEDDDHLLPLRNPTVLGHLTVDFVRRHRTTVSA